MKTLLGVQHAMQWTMFHGLLEFASNPFDINWSSVKPGEHDTNSHNPLFIMTS